MHACMHIYALGERKESWWWGITIHNYGMYICMYVYNFLHIYMAQSMQLWQWKKWPV